EDRRRQLREAQVEAGENAPRLGDVVRVPAHDVLVVSGPQLDVAQPELTRRDLASVPQVLGNLIGEDGEGERLRPENGAEGPSESAERECRGPDSRDKVAA